MQQREVLRHVERGESALSLQGAARVASDMLGREVAEQELGNLDLRELLRARASVPAGHSDRKQRDRAAADRP